MKIHVIGTTHRHSSLDVRERLAFNDDELPAALESMRASFAEEAVLISTCNRTELYIASSEEPFDAGAARAWLERWKGLTLRGDQLFALDDAEAAYHLFGVAAGTDSQVIGDIQIIGQVRTAYQISREQGAVGKLLDRLFTMALHTGKRVRSETELFNGAVSISYVAVELARKIFHPIAQKRTLVVGAGEAGELAARNLRDQGVGDVTITNRTESRGHDLIRRLGFGSWMPLEDLPRRLHEYDIVIVSTGAPTYLITYADARAAAGRRAGEPQLIVDISLPRNVDPRIDTIPTIFCKDLNDLNGVVEANVERRRAELPAAAAIIEEEVEKFVSWCRLLPVTPVIAQLKSRGEEIARAELERNRHRFAAEDFAHVERLVASVVRRILGLPLAHLLDAEGDAAHKMTKAEYVKLLFNLNQQPGAADANGTPAEGESQPGESTGHDAASHGDGDRREAV